MKTATASRAVHFILIDDSSFGDWATAVGRGLYCRRGVRREKVALDPVSRRDR
jgi:hypothetical protein